MKKLYLLVLLAIASFTLKSQTIVDIIVNSEDHNTLEAAVGAAGLVETLQGDGPFTVFAPTDAAFAALPEGTVDALLADPMGDLTDILLYHVIGAEVQSSSLTDGQLATTIKGTDVLVTINDDGVFINNAKVTVADVPADNGVVHVIDAVLLPRTTVADVIINSENHNTLEAAVGAAGLVNTLKGAGPFTVFAPTDAAFAALPEGTVDALLADPMGALTDILLYHVIGAEVQSSSLTDGQLVTTINGTDILVTINDDGVFINDAKVTVVDIETDNGVVHVIDAVLLPATVSTQEVQWWSGLQIYPNPVADQLNVDITDIDAQVSNYRLRDLNGKVLQSNLVQSNFFNVNTSELTPGFYLMEVLVEDKWIVKKVAK